MQIFGLQPLEAWHLPLWLLWTKTPLPDQTALQVMVSSLGAQQLDEHPDESDGLISPLAEEWLVQQAAADAPEGSQEEAADPSKEADASGDTCADETLPLEADAAPEEAALSLEPCDTQSAASLPVDDSAQDPPAPDAESDVPAEQVSSGSAWLHPHGSGRLNFIENFLLSRSLRWVRHWNGATVYGSSR
jgi:hypothetical protein